MTTEGSTQETTTDSDPTAISDQETTTVNNLETTAGNTEGTTTDSSVAETTTGNTEGTTTGSSAAETTTGNNREETTTDSTIETTTDSSTDETSTQKRPSGNSSCPPLEEGQAHFVCPTGFRRHPQDCQMFYQCTQSPETSHLSIVTFNCPNNTVYDEDAVQCRDKKDDDNCPMKSNNLLLRGILFGLDNEESPLVRYHNERIN